MSWLTELVMDNNSIAHAIFLYALVIAFGVILGKIKIRSESLLCFSWVSSLGISN